MLDKCWILCYTRRMKNMKHNITEADLLLNQEVKVTTGLYRGRIGIVEKVMADGHSLQIALDNRRSSYSQSMASEYRFKSHERVFLDVTFVSEIQEPTRYAKGEPNLGPDANSLLPYNKL